MITLLGIKVSKCRKISTRQVRLKNNSITFSIIIFLSWKIKAPTNRFIKIQGVNQTGYYSFFSYILFNLQSFILTILRVLNSKYPELKASYICIWNIAYNKLFLYVKKKENNFFGSIYKLQNTLLWRSRMFLVPMETHNFTTFWLPFVCA